MKVDQAPFFLSWGSCRLIHPHWNSTEAQVLNMKPRGYWLFAGHDTASAPSYKINLMAQPQSSQNLSLNVVSIQKGLITNDCPIHNTHRAIKCATQWVTNPLGHLNSVLIFRDKKNSSYLFIMPLREYQANSYRKTLYWTCYSQF